MVVSIRDRLSWSSLHNSVYSKQESVVNPDTGKPVSEHGIRRIFERHRRGAKYEKEEVERYEKDNPGKLERFFRNPEDELHDKYHFESRKDREIALKDYLRKFRKYRIHFGINRLTPEEKFDSISSIENKPHIQPDEVTDEVKGEKPLPIC